MSDTTAMLEAHVRFELGRFSGSALDEAVLDEVAALFDWLRPVRLGDLATPQQVTALVRRLAADLPFTDELMRLVEDGAGAVHDALLGEEATLGELVRREDYDRLARILAGMDDVHREVMQQLTTSDVYSRLVSHVLYHGVKSYVLTENVLARKIPGASSLVRLGQRGLSSAAPKLEKNIDKQLLAFVHANIHDTIRESQRYLDSLLDEQLLTTMAGETWAANADRSVASGAALIDRSQLSEAVAAGRSLWLHVRASSQFHRTLELAVETLFSLHADRTAGALLAELEITEEVVAREVASALRPAVDQARSSGHLEARIRARLEAFYSSFDAQERPAVQTARPRRRKPTASGP